MIAQREGNHWLCTETDRVGRQRAAHAAQLLLRCTLHAQDSSSRSSRPQLPSELCGGGSTRPSHRAGDETPLSKGQESKGQEAAGAGGGGIEPCENERLPQFAPPPLSTQAGADASSRTRVSRTNCTAGANISTVDVRGRQGAGTAAKEGPYHLIIRSPSSSSSASSQAIHSERCAQISLLAHGRGTAHAAVVHGRAGSETHLTRAAARSRPHPRRSQR